MSRINRSVAVLGFGAVALFLSAPAGAQYDLVRPAYPAYPAYPAPGPGFGLMPPHEADAVVRSLGLTPIAEPRVHGPVILVYALGQEGSQVRVTVDRRTGRVRQIVRIGPSAPQVATIQPGPYDEPDETVMLPPRPVPNADYQPNPPPPGPSGPQVITREGIRSENLPPPGGDPRRMEREADVTGTIPRTSAPPPVDPLMGVPPEFRNRPLRNAPAKDERVAARAPDDVSPRVTPMPRPRPTDAPTVAQRERAPAKAEASKPAATEPKAKLDQPPAEFPVQPLE
ncbi:MAG TPA: hypothetical protein VH765_06380 [Xanthobacteraceae bacterium]